MLQQVLITEYTPDAAIGWRVLVIWECETRRMETLTRRLRRIRYKIAIEPPTQPQFEEIFKRVCAARKIEYTAEGFARFVAYYQSHKLEFRSCHPRDLLDQLGDAARFFGRTPALEPQLIDMACDSYFVKL